MKKVDVIIPAYLPDKKNFILLQRAINSLEQQTFKDFNILIILNGLFDSFENIKNSLKFPQNTEFFNLDGKTSGAIARNFGISKSNAKFIAQLDADDQYHPEKLKEQISIFENDDSLDIVGCLAMTVKQDGSLVNSVCYPNKCESHEQITSVIEYENVICHSSVMFKRESFLKLGGYDTRYKPGTFWPNYGRLMWEDWDLWIRAKLSGMKMYNVSQHLYYWSEGTSVDR